MVSAQDYDAWGYLLQNRTFVSSKSKFKFTEKERDTESNYDYFGARYYDARIANWGSIDPFLAKHYDFSPYNYVLRNPLILVDPDGKQELVWDAIKNATVQTARTVAPLAGVSLSPIGIIIGSLVNPSQLGQIEKYNEFLEEQRLSIEEINPRYTTEEIVVTSLESRSFQNKKLSKYIGKTDKEIEESYNKMKNSSKKDRDQKEYKDLQTEMKARQIKQSGYKDNTKKGKDNATD